MNSKDWRPTAFVETTPGTTGEEDAERRAQRRSLLAFVQRLLVLDAAALVLTVTLIDKAFAQPQRREQVAVAVGAFLFSVVVGGVASLALIARSRDAGTTPAAAARGLQPWMAATCATFLGLAAGATALTWFFLANWLR
jgi:hypothetical protein